MTVRCTHVGSLPRPADVTELVFAVERGERGEDAAFDEVIGRATTDVLRRQRETGIKGLGQVLKSFRDRSADFTVYDRMSGADAYLNNLGPLTMPTQGTRAGLGVNVRDIAFESMPKRAPGDILGKSPSIRERN